MSILEKEFVINEIKGLHGMLEREVADSKFQLSSVDTKDMIQKRVDKMKSIIERIEKRVGEV